jgi:hypothetical protein
MNKLRSITDKVLRVGWEDSARGGRRPFRLSVWIEDTLHWWKTGESTIHCVNGLKHHRVFLSATGAPHTAQFDPYLAKREEERPHLNTSLSRVMEDNISRLQQMTRDTREETARIREETAIIEKETAQYREQTARLKEENTRLREEIRVEQIQRHKKRIKMEREAEDRLQSIELRLQKLEDALEKPFAG